MIILFACSRTRGRGNPLGRLHGCADRWLIWAYNSFHPKLNEFGHKAWYTIFFCLDVPIINLDIFPFDITEISETLSKPIAICIGSAARGFTCSLKIANPWHLRCLLRLGYRCKSKHCRCNHDGEPTNFPKFPPPSLRALFNTGRAAEKSAICGITKARCFEGKKVNSGAGLN